VKPTLQKFYSNEPVPANIRLTPNPPANMIEVIVSELRGTALVDVMKITIMTYGGQYNISKVEDLQTGIVSQFIYKTGYVLDAIWRTKGGLWTSQIKNITANTADIVPIAPPVFGDTTPVKFTSYSDLLKQAAAIEIPATAQDAIRQAKTTAGELSFHFSYTLNGYKVVITNPNAAVGGLTRMEFIIGRNGSINPATLQVTYRGAAGDLKPDGQLLFAGMKLLQPGASDVAALSLLTQVNMIAVDQDKTIHLKAGAQYYKVSWDGTKAKSEKELSPEAKAFVAALQTDLGTGFRVTATSQDDGTFLIQVVDSATYVSVGTAVSVKIASVAGGGIKLTAAPQAGITKYRIEYTTNFSTWSELATVAATAGGGLDYVDHPSGAMGFYRVTVAEAIQPPQGALKQITFILEEKGLLKGGSVSASYYQINNANGNLLFEGMKLLQPGASDVSVLGSMSRVQVTKVESASSIYLLYQNKYYKIYTEANQTKKMQMANLQGVYLPYDALFTGLRQEYPLTQITAAQFQESLEATVQYSDLVAQAYAFMTDPVNHILPVGTSFPVLLLKGINLSAEALSQFAMSPQGFNIVVMPLEPFLALPQDSMTRRNWIIRMTSHEATHLVDITESPNIAFLTSEAHAYAVTAKVARILGFSPEQIAKQEKVAAAFNILSNNPQVVTQIFNTGIQNFRFVGYESIQLPDGSVVRIGLRLDSQIRMVDVDVSAPAGSQISVIQNDASGRLNLRTQYGTGAVLWTQQYYYTGTNTTADYSKRTYVNGDIDYYNPAGQRFVDVLLDRPSITRMQYDALKNYELTYGGHARLPASYDDFIAGTINSTVMTAFRSALNQGFSLDPARFLSKINALQHIIILPYNLQYGNGYAYTKGNAIIINANTSYPPYDLADILLNTIMHEATHVADLRSVATPVIRDFAVSERNAWAESGYWFEKQGILELSNFNKYIADHVPDSNYSSIFAQLVIGTSDAWTQAGLSLSAVTNFLQQQLGLSNLKYVSSPTATMNLYGTSVNGYQFSFKKTDDTTVTLFCDLAGEWIYYNGQWKPNAERIATRLLDRTSISSAQYQAMVSWDSSVTGGFVRLPSTYSNFISAGYAQQQRVDLETFITRTFELDPADFFDKINRVQHIIISSYSNHGSGHFYPSSGSIIINSDAYGSYPSGDGWFFLVTTIFHEATHLKDFSGSASQDFKISEAHAYAENAHWEELFHRGFEYPWNSYNYFKFLADHIPDNGYNNVVARAVTTETQLSEQAMAPLNAAQQFLKPSPDGSVDLKYISSPSATLKKSGTDISGYTFTFQKPDQTTVGVFVDLLGQWIFCGGIWYQLQGSAWIPRGSMLSV